MDESAWLWPLNELKVTLACGSILKKFFLSLFFFAWPVFCMVPWNKSLFSIVDDKAVLSLDSSVVL